MWRLALLVLLLAAPTSVLAQAGGSAADAIGDAAARESATEGIFPSEGVAWFFYEAEASGFDAVLIRVREAASPRGFRVQELDLSSPKNLAFLAEIHQSRDLRWMERVELFVGARHLSGSTEILRFADSWKAGAEDIWARPARPPAVPGTPAGATTTNAAPNAQAGTPATSKEAESAAATGANAGQTEAATSSKLSETPTATVHVPAAGSGGELSGWLKRYRFSLLALVAAILFLALTVRRSTSKEGNPR